MGNFFSRAGFKTSEFLTLIIAIALPYADRAITALTGTGEPLDATTHIAGALLAGAYVGGRAWVKGKAAGGASSPASGALVDDSNASKYRTAAPGRF